VPADGALRHRWDAMSGWLVPTARLIPSKLGKHAVFISSALAADICQLSLVMPYGGYLIDN